MLTHVGFIGMSVPYMLSLTQAGKDDATAIPIDLVVIDTVGEADSQQDSVQKTTAPAATQADTPPADVAAFDVTAFDATLSASDRQPRSTQAAQLDRAATNSAENTNPEPSAQSGEKAGNSSQKPPPEGTTHQQSHSAEKPTASTNEAETTQDPLDAETNNAETNNAGANNAGASEAETGEAEKVVDPSTSEAAGSPSTSEEPEMLEGEALPPPTTNGESDQSNSGSGQSILMSIAETREDVVQDLPDEFPVLMSSRDLGRKNAKEAGCEQIMLPQSAVSLVYRLRVDVDGLVELATLQPGGEGDLLDDAAVSAIACLIEKSGLTFTPAMSGGKPKRDDSTLVTFELIDES